MPLGRQRTRPMGGHRPTNLAQSIINTTKEIVQTSKTVKNTLDNFKEVEKLYNESKKYYDALKRVNDLVRDAQRVKETILMVGEISDIYVNNYKKMLSDPNFRPGGEAGRPLPIGSTPKLDSRETTTCSRN